MSPSLHLDMLAHASTHTTAATQLLLGSQVAVAHSGSQHEARLRTLTLRKKSTTADPCPHVIAVIAVILCNVEVL